MGQLIISDLGPDGKICIDLKNGNGCTLRGEGEKPDVTLTLVDADFVAMAEGKLDGMQAFMGGKLKISGNMMLAQKLATILESARENPCRVLISFVCPLRGGRPGQADYLVLPVGSPFSCAASSRLWPGRSGAGRHEVLGGSLDAKNER